MISPTAIVQGVPLLTVPASLALISSRQFPGSSNVLLQYSARKQDRRV